MLFSLIHSHIVFTVFKAALINIMLTMDQMTAYANGVAFGYYHFPCMLFMYAKGMNLSMLKSHSSSYFVLKQKYYTSDYICLYFVLLGYTLRAQG